MTDRKSDWINVCYEDVSQSKSEKKSGVTIRFMTAPQDIPEVWRHSIHETPDQGYEAVFEFRYLATKEPSRVLETDGIRLEVGKNSSRIYKIIVPLNELTKGDVTETEIKIAAVIEGIENLEVKKKLRPAHADVIQAMLRQPGLSMAP